MLDSSTVVPQSKHCNSKKQDQEQLSMDNDGAAQLLELLQTLTQTWPPAAEGNGNNEQSAHNILSDLKMDPVQTQAPALKQGLTSPLLTGHNSSNDPMTGIRDQLQFLGHQVVRLLNVIGHTPCECSNCQHQLQKLQEEEHNENSERKHLSDSNTDRPIVNGVDIEQFQKGNRRSKYVSEEQKLLVAEYAHRHGSTAAARKFDMPPSVAAYYHRKMKKHLVREQKHGSAVNNNNYNTSQHSISSLGKSNGAVGRPRLSNQDSMPLLNTSDRRFSTGAASTEEGLDYEYGGQEADSSETGTGSPPHPLNFNIASNQQQQREKAASLMKNVRCSPGFRARGRPKLIGDDLDAELVEHLVEVKHTMPRGHLPASKALVHAKSYIMDRQPEILEENGGPINLKITWAMKLVGRINERYKEKFGDGPVPRLHAPDTQKLDPNLFGQQIFDQLKLKNPTGTPTGNSINEIIAHLHENASSDLMHARHSMDEDVSNSDDQEFQHRQEQLFALLDAQEAGQSNEHHQHDGHQLGQHGGHQLGQHDGHHLGQHDGHQLGHVHQHQNSSHTLKMGHIDEEDDEIDDEEDEVDDEEEDENDEEMVRMRLDYLRENSTVKPHHLTQQHPTNNPIPFSME